MTVTEKIMEFGPYRLDLGKRLLTRDAQPLILQPKTFELLVLLTGKDGEAVSKDELLQTLWPDTSVQEGSLNFQVSALRKGLGDPGAGWIEAVPKHGYRFTAPVAVNGGTQHAPPHW